MLGAGFAVGEDALDVSGVVVTGESDLALLRQGKITQAEYLDRLVESATRHLEGALSDERLEAIRAVVRAQFHADDEILLDDGAADSGPAARGSLAVDTEPLLGGLLRRASA